MRTLKKCVALLIIAAILCSFGCTFALYAYPGHTHTGHDTHCVLCTVAANISTLLQSADALATLFVLILGLVCLGVLCTLLYRRKPRHAQTPVTLKTKLSW